jgi:hypothetical protein
MFEPSGAMFEPAGSMYGPWVVRFGQRIACKSSALARQAARSRGAGS